MTETYKIIRFYFQNGNEVIKTGLTLDEARKHCLDRETSSRTAKSKKAKAITKKYGEWFDGYEKEYKNERENEKDKIRPSEHGPNHLLKCEIIKGIADGSVSYCKNDAVFKTHFHDTERHQIKGLLLCKECLEKYKDLQGLIFENITNS